MGDVVSIKVTFPDEESVAGVGASQRRRLRLYELEQGFHCSIVGTCLTPGMARQIVRRAKLSFDHDAQDYRLHSVLVSEAGRPGIVPRLSEPTVPSTPARDAASAGDSVTASRSIGPCPRSRSAAESSGIPPV